MQNPIIAALDVPTAARALELARELAPVTGAVKIGSELFTVAGPEIVRAMRATGAKVFLDLKFHDIPNTVASAIRSVMELDVQMLTIHTSGAGAMMRAAVDAAKEVAQKQGCPEPLILGVTVLTSMDGTALGEIGLEVAPAVQVERLARLAWQSGLRGLVCSPLEVPLLRSFLPAEFQLVTPGIRPAGPATDDQKRTLTPKQAMAAGSSWLVIGRPIIAAPNPRKAAEEILASLA